MIVNKFSDQLSYKVIIQSLTMDEMVSSFLLVNRSDSFDSPSFLEFGSGYSTINQQCKKPTAAMTDI